MSRGETESSLRSLERHEIVALATRPNVNTDIVVRFLNEVDEFDHAMDAQLNLQHDAKEHNWSEETVCAIKEGIRLARGKKNDNENSTSRGKPIPAGTM